MVLLEEHATSEDGTHPYPGDLRVVLRIEHIPITQREVELAVLRSPYKR